MKLILLINVIMPTIVGIIAFISRINTSETFKVKMFFLFLLFFPKNFSLYEQLKFYAQLSLARKKFDNLKW